MQQIWIESNEAQLNVMLSLPSLRYLFISCAMHSVHLYTGIQNPVWAHLRYNQIKSDIHCLCSSCAWPVFIDKTYTRQPLAANVTYKFNCQRFPVFVVDTSDAFNLVIKKMTLRERMALSRFTIQCLNSMLWKVNAAEHRLTSSKIGHKMFRWFAWHLTIGCRWQPIAGMDVHLFVFLKQVQTLAWTSLPTQAGQATSQRYFHRSEKKVR